jgi:hypothetical protein
MKSSNVGMAIWAQVPGTDPTGSGIWTIFYPHVAPVPDPNRDGYGVGIFIHPQVTHRVPEFSSHKISINPL